MRRWLIAGVVGVICVTVPGGPVRQTPAQVVRRGSWHSSYEAGRAAARQSGKPMMVVFRCER